MITYEYPLIERIRTLLRLEDLFEKAHYFSAAEGAYEHHAALLALFEILDVAGRADLKVDLVQELERQRQILLAFRDNPCVSEEALASSLYEIEQASSSLLSMTGKVGQHIRDSEWLKAIRSRAAIPGGVCEFDIPAYHYWLNQSPAKRQQSIDGWLDPMQSMADSARIVLRLLRASGRSEVRVARNGVFQMMTGGRVAPQMVCVRVAQSEVAVPEISANKHALNIRFVSPETISRSRQTQSDISFELALCNL